MSMVHPYSISSYYYSVHSQWLCAMVIYTYRERRLHRVISWWWRSVSNRIMEYVFYIYFSIAIRYSYQNFISSFMSSTELAECNWWLILYYRKVQLKVLLNVLPIVVKWLLIILLSKEQYTEYEVSVWFWLLNWRHKLSFCTEYANC